MSTATGDNSQKEEISENQNKSSKEYKWWIQMVIYSTFVLCGQAIGTLLDADDEYNSSRKYSKRKYAICFLCTLAASAGYGLMLSATRLSFEKVFKMESLCLIIEMTVYESSLANLLVIFASGEWRDLRQEMNRFEFGRRAYVMNLIGPAVSWRWFNRIDFQGVFIVLSMLGVPMTPVFSVLFLHEKMTGDKVISMFFAMWGFLSYMYQHYLDDLKSKAEKRDSLVH